MKLSLSIPMLKILLSSILGQDISASLTHDAGSLSNSGPKVCDNVQGECTDPSIVASVPITAEGEMEVVHDMRDISPINASTSSNSEDKDFFLETNLHNDLQNIVVEELPSSDEEEIDSTENQDKEKEFEEDEEVEYNFADKNIECSSWADTGECYKNAPYMLNNCLPSCIRKEEGLISIALLMEWDRICENKYQPKENEDEDICDFWANEGLCTPDKEFMIDQCRKSCLACAPIE